MVTASLFFMQLTLYSTSQINWTQIQTGNNIEQKNANITTTTTAKNIFIK